MSCRIASEVLHLVNDVDYLLTYFETRSSYSSQNIMAILSSAMKWARHVAHIDVRNFVSYVLHYSERAQFYRHVRSDMI